MTKGVLDAAKQAREQTGLAVAIDAATVTDLPYNYEDRVREARGLTLEKLTFLVPDKYDLVLSKAMRCYPHDLDAIEGINERHRLSMKTLVERFEAELMNEAIAERRKICLNVAIVVARLHGVEDGRKLAERWGAPAPSAKKRRS